MMLSHANHPIIQPDAVIRQTLKLGWLLGLMLLCGACQPQEPAVEAPDALSAYPRTIQGALGSTTLTAPPQRIVTLGSGVEDIVVALGHTPVGISAAYRAGDKDGYLPWLKAHFAALGQPLPPTFGIHPELDVEAITTLQPDLILATQSHLTQAQFDQLSLIAPVVAYPERPIRTPPDQHIALIGTVLAKETEAQALLQQHEALLRQHRAPIAARNLSFASIVPLSIGVIASPADDPRVDLLYQLGMHMTPSLSLLPRTGQQNHLPLGFERFDLLNEADVVVTWHTSKQMQATLEQHPLFLSVTPIQQGGYLAVADPNLSVAVFNATPMSIAWALPRFLPLLHTTLANMDQGRPLPPLNHKPHY